MPIISPREIHDYREFNPLSAGPTLIQNKRRANLPKSDYVFRRCPHCEYIIKIHHRTTYWGTVPCHPHRGIDCGVLTARYSMYSTSECGDHRSRHGEPSPFSFFFFFPWQPVTATNPPPPNDPAPTPTTHLIFKYRPPLNPTTFTKQPTWAGFVISTPVSGLLLTPGTNGTGTRTLSRALNMTVPTVIAGQVKHTRTTVEQPGLGACGGPGGRTRTTQTKREGGVECTVISEGEEIVAAGLIYRFSYRCLAARIKDHGERTPGANGAAKLRTRPT